MTATSVFAAPAAAQEARDPPPAFRQTTIEVAFGGIASYGGGGVDLKVSGVSVPLGRASSN